MIHNAVKKESIIVGIFGLSLGLLVAWGIWNFKGTGPQSQELTVSPSPSVESNPTPTPSSLSLTLDNPKEGTIATDSSILVAGKTKAGSTIVIATNINDYALTADQNGGFSQEIDLEEGENTIVITSYDQNNKEESIERSIIYVKES